jgi:NDP-sugar pyrophosphorylase family protein
MKRPTGSASAIVLAKKYIVGDFVVIHSSKAHARELLSLLKNVPPRGAGVIGAPCENPKEYGVLRVKKGKVLGIQENPSRASSCVRTIGCYVLPEDFFARYESLVGHKEDDLISILNSYAKEGRLRVRIVRKHFPSLKYPWHLLSYSRSLFAHPFSSFRAKSATIAKGVRIKGKVYIGAHSSIGEGSSIQGPVYIGDHVSIGKMNVIGPRCDIEDRVRTGPSCKMVSCVVQEGAHIRSAVLVDSVIGKKCRIGKGFVSVSKRADGEEIYARTQQGKKVSTFRSSFGIAVGDSVQIGDFCVSIPGVLIGQKNVISSGTVIIKNLKEGSRDGKKGSK